MPVPKWLVVARNEYRIRISRIRKISPYFPYLAIGLLAVYVAFIAPTLADLFIDEFLALILSQVAVAMVQVVLFMIFLYFTMIPITHTLREVQTGQLEIFLAAPIKPSDVLLGEFLGAMPFYAIAVTVIAGFFTALLTPLGLDLLQIAMILIIFIITFFSAIWIGTVFAAILRTRLGKMARGRDIGKALGFVVALPIVALIWAIWSGGLFQTLTDPGTGGVIRVILGLLPSSWGAEVICGFASNPSNISAVGFETLTRFGGLVAFFVAALWLGGKVAGRAYSLEPFTFTPSRAKPDGVFYNVVRYLGGGGSSGTLLVSIFKDYSRRFENISKIVYMVGILALMNVGIIRVPAWGQYPEIALIVPQFILPFLVAFVVGEVTLRGKEALSIYRKAPAGVGRLVKARLLHGWLVMVPITAAIMAVSTILNPQTMHLSLLATGLAMLFVAAIVAFVLGIFLLNPAFSEKSGNYVVNLQLIFVLPIGLLLVPLLVFELPLLHTLCCFTIPVSWLVGIVFLYLGKRKLSRIE